MNIKIPIRGLLYWTKILRRNDDILKKSRSLSKTSQSSIGIIGGSDGPTAVFVCDEKDQAQKHSKWQQELAVCRKQTVPKERMVTGDELKQHLVNEYGAIEMEISEGKKTALKICVLSNYYPETLLEWAKKDHVNRWQAAQNVSDEEYGLRYTCLTIPRTEKTERFYITMEHDNSIRDHRSLLSKLFRKSSQELNVNIDEMEFQIELSTGYMQLNNGCQSLFNEVILWRGVTKEDIETQTPSFLGYAAAMRDEGILQL